MGLAILLSAAAMTAIVGIHYLIVSGAFAAAIRVRHRSSSRTRSIMPVARRPDGRRWRSIRSRRSLAL
jgi:hypothetical protein